MRIFFDASPWALPLTGITLLALLPVSPGVGRWVGCHPVTVWLWMSSIAGYLAVTGTPGLGTGGARGRTVSLELHSLSLRDLVAVNSEALNVWLCVPMGLTTAWIAIRTSRRLLLLVPFALPIAAEGWQYAVPALGRSAFLLDDVVANEVGVALGVLAAVVGQVLWWALRPRASVRIGDPRALPPVGARRRSRR